MTGLDPLADLGPNPPRAAEKKARLIEMAEYILAARKRRAPLSKIAERLNVSPDYLSQVMAEHHGEAWAINPERRTDKRKGKKKAVTRTRNLSVTKDELTDEHTVKSNGRSTDGGQDKNTTAEPTVGPSPETGQSPFLKMGKKL